MSVGMISTRRWLSTHDGSVVHIRKTVAGTVPRFKCPMVNIHKCVLPLGWTLCKHNGSSTAPHLEGPSGALRIIFWMLPRTNPVWFPRTHTSFSVRENTALNADLIFRERTDIDSYTGFLEFNVVIRFDNECVDVVSNAFKSAYDPSL